jgi:mycofactocin precursor
MDTETLPTSNEVAAKSAADTAIDVPTHTVQVSAATLVVDELLVEEISIDGMCGVY